MASKTRRSAVRGSVNKSSSIRREIVLLSRHPTQLTLAGSPASWPKTPPSLRSCPRGRIRLSARASSSAGFNGCLRGEAAPEASSDTRSTEIRLRKAPGQWPDWLRHLRVHREINRGQEKSEKGSF